MMFLTVKPRKKIFCVVIFISWNTIFDEVIVPALSLSISVFAGKKEFPLAFDI